MKKTLFGLYAVIVVAIVSGCSMANGVGHMAESASVGGGPFPTLAVVDGATIMATDKTVVDHIVSFTSGKNCSTVRKEQGMYYCEEDEPKDTTKIYCYRTLGGVSCYEKPFHDRAALEDKKEPVRRR